MDETKINEIIAVGKASTDAIRMAASLVKQGVRYIDVAEKTEKYMKDQGFGLAFPLNISVNQIAAHYTPTLNDDGVFTDKDLVKIDFGAEKNGILGDGALSIDLSGMHGKMIETAELALANAISKVRAGVEVREIGKIIDETVQAAGFKPIMNLGGHAIEENNLHSGSFIPNYDNGDTEMLEEDSIVAIEPFITTKEGKGMVKDARIYEIYTYSQQANVRNPVARELLKEIEKSYCKNPFAVRWLSNISNSKFGLYSGISELAREGAIEPNPVLVEIGNGVVAQAEVELLVEKEGCKIITLANHQAK